jgi:hypothetical protein
VLSGQGKYRFTIPSIEKANSFTDLDRRAKSLFSNKPIVLKQQLRVEKKLIADIIITEGNLNVGWTSSHI